MSEFNHFLVGPPVNGLSLLAFMDLSEDLTLCIQSVVAIGGVCRGRFAPLKHYIEQNRGCNIVKTFALRWLVCMG